MTNRSIRPSGLTILNSDTMFDPAPTCTIVPLAQSGTSPDRLVEIEATGILPPGEIS